MTNLLDYAAEVVLKYPQLKEELDGLIELCVNEIEEGGSVTHDISLCWSDIEETVKEHEASILSRNL